MSAGSMDSQPLYAWLLPLAALAVLATLTTLTTLTLVLPQFTLAAEGPTFSVAQPAFAGLAKTLSPTIEGVVRYAGMPQAVVGIAIALDLPLSSMTVAAGHATLLQGTVHLVVFAVFLFLAMIP